MIRLEDAALQVGSKVLLHGTTLTVERGHRLALVGTSGAGKSTLLRLVLGLAVPTKGRVTVLGQALQPGAFESIRLKVGYVVQDGGLFPHLKAGPGAALVASHLGWSPSRIRQRLSELSALVGVPPELLDRYPFQLSGGQRQRIALVRALFLDPELLLFDEPFAALDPVSSARLEDDLVGVIDRLGKTLLFVSHDVAQASRIGHELAVMHEGRILQRGTYDELAARPAHPFVHELLGAERPPRRGATT